ncbi:MAG TPA: mechanosensitive ion channel protein [Prevotella sp.]|nr:mechanosensitive ion channel protein [Prevotella sp.]
MEKIRLFVEHFIQLCGISGPAVPIVRHAALALVAILLATLSGFLCRHILVPLAAKLTSKTEAKWDDVIFNHNVLISLSRIIPAIVIWWLLPMVFYQYPTVREILARITAVYITVMSIKASIVFLDGFNELDSKHRSATQQYFHSFRGVLRIVIIFVGVIITVALIIGKSPMTLFAGLGATSAILMLVFKDTISGLVAGIRLTSNDMVHKGDWITVPKANANGYVEDISLTTVKIRNFDNTIITVTPQTLVEDSFQNWIGMQESDGRRVKRIVYFDFRSVKVADSALKKHLMDINYFQEKDLEGEQINMSLFRTYIEMYLTKRDDVNHNMTLMVRQLEATTTGLPIEFYFFLKDKVWIEYEHHLADIMERIYAIAPEFGLTIYQQYPEQ